MNRQQTLIKLSVVLATRNEEMNIGRCLESVKGIADEIVVFDEYSSDKTRDIAKEFGAKVFLEPHHDIFHITKQRAMDKALGQWILQLDADEVVTPALADEIKNVINLSSEAVLNRINPDRKKERNFLKHQMLVEKRDGVVGKRTGDVVAFYVPRLNVFLGRPLKYGGVYPDGVIRLVKKGCARFPQKSVHEQIEVDGRVGWLFNDLEHHDSPTLSRYLARLNRYTDLHAQELKRKKVQKNFLIFLNYTLIKFTLSFFNIYFRHKGFMDGVPGFLWAFFSASHYPISYFKYFVAKE